MLSSFFRTNTASATQAPFEVAEEFKATNAVIATIKSKREAMHAAAQTNGASSIDYIKWHILDTLIKQLDEKIAAYNANEAHAAMQTKIELSADLYDCVNELWLHSNEALKVHRNSNKKVLSATAGYGVIAASIAAGVTVPLTFFGSGLLTYYFARKAGDSTAGNMGLYSQETDTAKMVRHLKLELARVISSLRYISGEENAFETELFEANSEERRERREARSNLYNMARQAVSGRSSVPGASLLNEYSPATKAYIERMKIKMRTEGKYADQVAKLNLSDDEQQELFADFKDPSLLEVFCLPVLLNGNYHELDSLLRIQADSKGERIDPLNRLPFYLRDIQTGKDMADEIETLISKVKAERQGLSPAATADTSTSAGEQRRMGM